MYGFPVRLIAYHSATKADENYSNHLHIIADAVSRQTPSHRMKGIVQETGSTTQVRVICVNSYSG